MLKAGAALALAAAMVAGIVWNVWFYDTASGDDEGEAAYWYLPRGHYPTATATSVDILVLEVGCSSGKGAAGNMLPAVVSVTEDQVIISVETHPRTGDLDCPSNPLAPLTVELGQPLGDRTLVDANGGTDATTSVELYLDAVAPPFKPKEAAGR